MLSLESSLSSILEGDQASIDTTRPIDSVYQIAFQVLQSRPRFVHRSGVGTIIAASILTGYNLWRDESNAKQYPHFEPDVNLFGNPYLVHSWQH